MRVAALRRMHRCRILGLWTITSLACGAPPLESDGGRHDASAPIVRHDAMLVDANIPVTPLDCAAIEATPAGTWENITPPTITLSSERFGIVHVVAVPSSPGMLYAAAARAGIFRSLDCGATWEKVNTGENGEQIDTGIPWLFLVDPVDPRTLYADAFQGDGLAAISLYKSSDGGVSWRSLWDDEEELQEVARPISIQPSLAAIDPTDHLHVIVDMHVTCTGPHNGFCMAETMDGGETWRALDGPPELDGWIEDAAPIVVDASTILIGAPRVPVYLTTDHGESWREVSAAGGVQLLRTGDGWSYLGAGQSGVQRSRDLVVWEDLETRLSEISFGLAQDGNTIYAANRWQTYDGSYARISAGVATDLPVPSPLIECPGGTGAYSIALDTHHRVLYSANQCSGLFRMRLE
jgi:photosystem II stability/assembly factor-like uncharacterized protein